MGSRSVITIFLLLATPLANGSACCGGGSSLPTLITGDYRGQVVLTGSNSAVTHDTSVSGKIDKRDGSNQETTETIVLSASYLLSPLWQIGLTIPFKYNTHRAASSNESSHGISDLKTQIGYEFLPEYSFSLWKPRGFIFLEQTFPTSKSTYTAEKPLRTDSLGNGFYTAAVGISFVKIIYNYDFLFMTKIYQSLTRRFNQNNESLRVRPGFGHSALLGGGISPSGGNFRLGGTLLYSREGSSAIEGNTSSKSNARYYWEAGLSASYLLNKYSISLSYNDQSFFGQASNTTLSKSINLSVIKFFDI